MASITFPYRAPRSYQQELYTAMSGPRGKKRAVCVWHRRSGKTLTFFQYQIGCALQKPGYYPYFFPKFKQGRKILWDGQDKEGKPFLSYIPRELIIGKPVKDEMVIRLKCKTGGQSLWQIVGTDNYDAIVGTNPIGPVFDEYTLQNPAAFDFVRPILAENNGWAGFTFTPRGRGHGYRLYHEWSLDTERPWHRSYLPCTATRRDGLGEDGSSIVTVADVEAEIRQGMHPARAQQEFFCSWAGALEGAIYGWLMDAAHRDKRVTKVMYDRSKRVHTCWDIGRHDHTSIWWFQQDGDAIKFLRYHEERGRDLSHFVQLLRSYDYDYGDHWFPWDMMVKDWAWGSARIEVAKELLGANCFIAPKLKIEEGIDQVRRIFHLFYWDEELCARGLDVLQAYSYETADDENLDDPRFKAVPEHNWASHGPDAIRVLATGYYAQGGMGSQQGRSRHIVAQTDFDPITGTPIPSAVESGMTLWEKRMFQKYTPNSDGLIVGDEGGALVVPQTYTRLEERE